MVHAAMLRSPHAHARITRIDTSKAKAAPGVVAVYTGADIEALQPTPCAWLLPNAKLKVATYPCVATDIVRYVGDIVAVVVAETPAQAYDALELIDVDYETLPSVIDPEQAVKAGAPQLHADVPNNQAFHWTVAGGDVDAAFKKAEVVVKERIVQQRLIPNAMEPRATLAKWAPASGELTLWNTTQNPHILRFLTSVVTGVPEDKLRVIAPEVGGGFGSKIAAYPADFLTIFCAMQLNRPVKWNETRSENYQATTHGRDHIQEVELAATKDGKILGLRATSWSAMGAYLSTAAPGHSDDSPRPHAVGRLRHPGDQGRRLRRLHQHDAGRGVSRRRAPRGDVHGRADGRQARSEARLDPVDGAPEEHDPALRQRPHGRDRADLRQRRLSGRRCKKLLEHVKYTQLRKEQAEARKNGRLVGIGVGTYVEICGLGPSQVAGAIGFQGGLWESAIVRVHPTGKVHVFIGASPHGQGEETTFAQLVASEIGVGCRRRQGVSR